MDVYIGIDVDIDIDIDIDITDGKSDLISAIRFVHNLSIVNSAGFDAVDDVDNGEGRLDGRLVLEVLDWVGLATLFLLVKGNVEYPKIEVTNFTQSYVLTFSFAQLMRVSSVTSPPSSLLSKDKVWALINCQVRASVRVLLPSQMSWPVIDKLVEIDQLVRMFS